MIRVGAGLSLRPEARGAAVEAALAARERGDVRPPSLAVVFASPHHAEASESLVDAVHEAAAPEALIGCVGESVIGERREVEGEPAVTVWLGWFPEPVRPYHIRFLAEGVFEGFPHEEASGTHLMVADPFTFPPEPLLRDLEEEDRGTVVVGGMASGGVRPGTTRLFLDREVLDEGAVGVRLPDGVRIRTLVSQGCTPIGPAFTITRGGGNVIEELAGAPPLERIREVHAAADERTRALMARGLHLGRVIDEHKDEFERGDFLVRGVIGADRETGAIAVGDHVAVGETVRFHVRDSGSADEDLRSLLDGVPDRPAGALLFTCNGRGARLFGEPDHDAALVSARLGDPPLAGFFCAGELGPVGPRTFLHGFTASLALLYDA
jgi:small ligand-binding sensory domain FIST